MVFARKPDGSWRICFDYWGLSAITRPAVEPFPHIDALLDGTRGSRFFIKLDLASSYHQLRVRAADLWKTSLLSQMGKFEWNMVPFGLQGASSLLMRVIYQALTVGLDFPGGATTTLGTAVALVVAPEPPATVNLGAGLAPTWRPRPAPTPMMTYPWWGPRGVGPAGPVRARVHGRLAGALANAGAAPARRCGGARDLPPASAVREELQVRVLAAGARHRLSHAGVSVDPRKVQSILEWATPT